MTHLQHWINRRLFTLYRGFRVAQRAVETPKVSTIGGRLNKYKGGRPRPRYKHYRKDR